MRRTTIGILVVTAAALAGCGSGSTFANLPRPPTPVDLTVYISNQRVLVSPASVGAGPVIFIVTNGSAKTQALTIQRAAGGGTLAATGPITPQATAQVTVNFMKQDQGDYAITTNPSGGTDAARANPSSIRPGALHIGSPRPSADNVLLQP
jgi:hypothetical protein